MTAQDEQRTRTLVGKFRQGHRVQIDAARHCPGDPDLGLPPLPFNHGVYRGRVLGVARGGQRFPYIVAVDGFDPGPTGQGDRFMFALEELSSLEG